MTQPPTGPSPGISDQVTVLVFKDNYAARSFQVPLAWISRLGFILGASVGLTLISGFLAIKYYRIARDLSPARVLDLEMELADLRNNYKALETRVGAQLSQTSSQTTTALAPTQPMPIPSVVMTTASTPAPVATTTVAATVPTPAATIAAKSSSSTSNGALLGPINLAQIHQTQTATQAESALPDPASLPFIITKPTLRWRGNRLRVRFSIQYTQGDGGNQQGRIAIVGRGAESAWSYPEGLVPKTSPEAPPAKGRGEFFSVSRYRAVDGELGPVRSRKEMQSVEVMIFDTDSKLLVRQKLSTEGAGVDPIPVARPQVTPPEEAAPAEPEAAPAQPSTEATAPAAAPNASVEPETAAPGGTQQ